MLLARENDELTFEQYLHGNNFVFVNVVKTLELSCKQSNEQSAKQHEIIKNIHIERV